MPVGPLHAPGCSALFGRQVSKPDGKHCMLSPVDRAMPDYRAGRIVTEKVVIPPVLRGPDGPGHESAAAIGADISKNGIDAGGAERAFVRADARLQRVWWKRLVAVLASWS